MHIFPLIPQTLLTAVHRHYASLFQVLPPILLRSQVRIIVPHVKTYSQKNAKVVHVLNVWRTYFLRVIFLELIC